MATVNHDHRWLLLFDRASRVAAIVALLIGGTELAVWLSQPSWISLTSSLYYMKANAALAVSLLAVACLITPWPGAMRRRVSLFASSAVLALAIMTLLEYSTGRSLGIDTWLAIDPTVDRGRMAAQSAATLAFGALAMLTMTAERGPAAWMSNAMVAVGLLTVEMMILGFVDRATLLYDVTGQSPTAPQSAAAQSLVVTAIACRRAARGALPVLTGRARGSQAVRAILPTVVVLPLGLGLIQWAVEAAGLVSPPYGQTLFDTAQTLALGAALIGFARSMNRLDDRYRQERQAREELERYVAVCAWSRKIRWQGEWLSIEDFLKRRFNLAVSHGISDEVLAEQLYALEGAADLAAVPVIGSAPAVR